VLITSLPINALLGLLVLIAVLPLFVDALKVNILDFSDILFNFLRVF
jgi:hypothetical protein